MTEKMDRRKVRTQKLIRQSVMKLIEEKGVKNITVSDITAYADINRGTFYLHFRDVNDLLEQYQKEFLVEIKAKVKDIDIFEFIKHRESKTAYPVIMTVLETIAKHADLLKVLLGPNGDPAFSIKLKEFVKARILDKLTSSNFKENNMMVPSEYLATFIASAHLGIIHHWIDTGMRQTPEEIASIITHIAVQGPLATLRFEK
ncbi:TetR/AcrR family transcriptional regulator [Bacillus sp. H-16]|uniref:TetR/AcrR family transcriptional regulator n=1 Tax=Alteribacter salitolerans TaxID=2912333 RepID=UPI0019636CF9|nr:TetR/AcrR family transcriptional regulator [Alteribacter salitolerans]MBM7095156.1 TetR/AcrR family transcriptional regulator [Alteribacter salitolerans]